MDQHNKLLPMLSVLIVVLTCSGATWVMGPGKGTYAAAGGSTPLATDDFTRADNADLGSAWDVVTSENSWRITGNAAVPVNGGLDSSESNNSVAWPNDQYAQAAITITGTGDQTGAGIILRAATGARTYYRVVVNKAGTNNVEVGKFVAATYTQLGQRTQAWTDGDVLKFQVVGSTLKVFRNGTQMGADFTDSSIASGRPGINLSGSVTSALLDNWESGSIP